MPSKEIILASLGTQREHPLQQSFYTRKVSTLRLEPPCLCHTVADRSRQFNVSKEIALLPPKPNETLMGLKTNKFGYVTCAKYKSTTPCPAFDGVRTNPYQIHVTPPTKRSSSSSSSSREPKQPRVTIVQLEKMIEEQRMEIEDQKEKLQEQEKRIYDQEKMINSLDRRLGEQW
jgi:uncharacterized coiled-coil protein SlyX